MVITSLLLCLAALPLFAQQDQAQLLLASGSVSTGGTTEIEVRLEDSDSRIAALTFVIEYDAEKLSFDSSHHGRGSVTFQLPSGFVAHTFPMPERSRVGIAIFDPDAPVSVLKDGLLARIRFGILPEAEGVATLRLNQSANAADRDAASVPIIGPAEPLGVTLPSSDAGRSASQQPQPNPSLEEGLESQWGGHADGFVTRRLVPLVVPLDGADAGSWRMDLTLENPTKREIVTRLTMMRSAMETQSNEIRLAPGETRVIEDVVHELSQGMTLDRSGRGTVIVEATSSEVRINSNLYASAPGEESRGRPMQWVNWDELIHASRNRTLIAGSTDAPMHLELVNAGRGTATIDVEVKTSSGMLMMRQTHTLLAGGTATTIDLRPSATLDPRETLMVQLSTRDADAHVLAYLVQTDRGTGAPLVQVAR